MPYIGNPIYQAAFPTDTFSGDSSTTAFTMSVAPAGTSNVLVAISGVLQDPSTYGVTGTTLNFTAAPPTGTSNISVRYLGVPATGVTTTAYYARNDYTATAGQTSFTVPSYTVGFVQVLRNGVLLGLADYTATTGTTIVLASGATAGDLITVISFLISSVLNAIPNTAGSVSSSNIVAGAVGTTQLADASITQAKLSTNVAGNGPAFSVYKSSAQTLSGATWTKITFDTEEFDTNNNFASSRFTPTVAGYYQINGQVSNGLNTQTVPAIYKNGSIYKAGVNFSNGYGSVVSSLVYLNGSTDYVELYGYFASGGNTGSGIESTYFNGSMTRSA